MDLTYLLAGLAIMFAVTYLPRTLPLVLFRREITSVWVKSFLFYVPYAVLAALTIPAIFFSTNIWVSGAVGLIVAIALAWWGRQLMVVALSAVAAVWITEALVTFVMR